MAFNQDSLTALDEALAETAFDAGAWETALGLIAQAGGGWASELIGVGAQGVMFSLVQGHTAQTMAEFQRMNGYLEEANPRMGAFQRMAPNTIASEPDFVGDENLARLPLYQELLAPKDSDLSCIARLTPARSLALGFCTMRSRRQGHFQADERDRLARLMPRLDAALKLRMAIDSRNMQVTTAMLEGLGGCAFLFDVWGRVVALSESASGLTAEQSLLRLTKGRLAAVDPRSDRDLQAAITRACDGNGPMGDRYATIFLRSEERTVSARLAPMPSREPAFHSAVSAILVLPREREKSAATAMLRQAFGLSAAESDITLMIADGKNVAAISQTRGSSSQTVRDQLKSIYEKTGARSQSHLVSIALRLTQL
jgi:DNA-binding CsgD family transcriptional regulator